MGLLRKVVLHKRLLRLWELDMPHKKLTKSKAKKILRHGSVRGKKLTAKQRRFMGARAGGARMKKK